jgi:hypothetical protein
LIIATGICIAYDYVRKIPVESESNTNRNDIDRAKSAVDEVGKELWRLYKEQKLIEPEEGILEFSKSLNVG